MESSCLLSLSIVFFVRYNFNSPYLLKPNAKNYYFLAQNPAVHKPFNMKIKYENLKVLIKNEIYWLNKIKIPFLRYNSVIFFLYRKIYKNIFTTESQSNGYAALFNLWSYLNSTDIFWMLTKLLFHHGITILCGGISKTTSK